MWLLVIACGSPDPVVPDDVVPPPSLLGGDRPASVVLPAGYNEDQSWPLVVLLHGYGANSSLQDLVFGLGLRVDSLGFILVKPEGTVDDIGLQFWNATPECCDFYGSGVDDVDYLTRLIDDATAAYPVSSVALVGHSNGGFMSYRMACEEPDLIDRVAVLAGATYKDEADCVGTAPVSVLHIHGTADPTVAYASDLLHAGAEESVGRWSSKAHCSPEPVDVGPKDYLTGIGGSETAISQWTGCDAGVDVQLWSAAQGDHFFLATGDPFKDDVATWLVRQPY